nr:MAG TPA: hypothetical protein [Caudoviricetes sp.]
MFTRLRTLKSTHFVQTWRRPLPASDQLFPAEHISSQSIGRRLEINRLPHGFRLILFRSRPLRFKAAVRIFRNWFEVVIGNLWE